MKFSRLQVGRLVAVVVAALAVGGVAPTPARAAGVAQNCYNNTGPTYGAWSPSMEYNYGRGGWCMHDPVHADFRLVFQNDGNLVWYVNESGNNPANAVWSSHTAGIGASLSFQRDGTIRIYNADGKDVFRTLPCSCYTYSFVLRFRQHEETKKWSVAAIDYDGAAFWRSAWV